MATKASKHPRSVATESPFNERERAPDMPFEEGVHDELSPDLRHRMISEAAYFLHIQRGYEDGYDMDDWLQAEAEIDHLLLNPQEREAPRFARKATE
jgi:hypothetical protein